MKKYSFNFKNEKSSLELQEMYLKLRRKLSSYHIPVICEGDFIKDANKGTNKGDFLKYLVSPTLTVAEFIFFIRKNLRIKSNEGLFVLFNGEFAVPATRQMTEVYEEYKDPSGFLYVAVMKENVFG